MKWFIMIIISYTGMAPVEISIQYVKAPNVNYIYKNQSKIWNLWLWLHVGLTLHFEIATYRQEENNMKSRYRWEIVNYTPFSFWHIKVQYTHCMELDGGGITS